MFHVKWLNHQLRGSPKSRGGSRAAATSKMERFVIIVNGFQPLTIITKRSTLDAAAVLDPSLQKGLDTISVEDCDLRLFILSK